MRFLALSVSDAAEDVIAVIRAGARGYVTKTIAGPELADAVRRVHDGDAVFSPRLAGFVLDAFAGAPPPARGADPDLDQLTPREREVLQHLARGYMYKEIAHRLGISVKTVEAHVSAVLRKLQLSSRHELAALPTRTRRARRDDCAARRRWGGIRVLEQRPVEFRPAVALGRVEASRSAARARTRRARDATPGDAATPGPARRRGAGGGRHRSARGRAGGAGRPTARHGGGEADPRRPTRPSAPPTSRGPRRRETPTSRRRSLRSPPRTRGPRRGVGRGRRGDGGRPGRRGRLSRGRPATGDDGGRIPSPPYVREGPGSTEARSPSASPCSTSWASPPAIRN